MRLAAKVTAARCPRCGAGLPYWSLRLTGRDEDQVPVRDAISCPRCAARLRVGGSAWRQKTITGFVLIFVGLAMGLTLHSLGYPEWLALPGLLAADMLIFLRLNPVEAIG